MKAGLNIAEISGYNAPYQQKKYRNSMQPLTAIACRWQDFMQDSFLINEIPPLAIEIFNMALMG
jgi:hypothetical protein